MVIRAPILAARAQRAKAITVAVLLAHPVALVAVVLALLVPTVAQLAATAAMAFQALFQAQR